MIEELRKQKGLLGFLFLGGTVSFKSSFESFQFMQTFIKAHPIIIALVNTVITAIALSIIYLIFIWVWDLKKTSKHIYTDKILIQPSTRNLTLKPFPDANNADQLKSDFGFVVSCYGKTKEDLKGVVEISYPPDLTLLIIDSSIDRSRRGYMEKKITFSSKPEFIDIQGVIVKPEHLSNFDSNHDRKIRICVKSTNQGNAILDSCEVNLVDL